MPRSTKDIAAEIAAFDPINGNWLGLEALMVELWRDGSPEAAIPELLRVFERFPDDDGSGVFWSIVHGLETLPGYQVHLLNSVNRAPSDMAVTMLGRLLNAGEDHISGVPVRQILQEAAAHPDAGPSTKAAAESFLERSAP